MNLDLASLFPDLEALTPDGRWTLLQEWLRENPKYAKKIDRWVNQTPEEVFTELCEEHGKFSARVVKAIIGVEMTRKILSAIETMQACYRERAAYDNQPIEKEIKNVRTDRQIGRKQSAKNPRRVVSKTERKD